MWEERTQKPMNVKEILSEIKDTIELMLDLAYSSILFNEKYFGQEVMELEDFVDNLIYKAGAMLMKAARGTTMSEELAKVLKILTVADKIAEAAADIAEIQLTGVDLPSHFLKTLNLLEETLVCVNIKENSSACGKSVNEIEEKTKMKIIAVRHEGHWIINPSEDLRLVVNDRIVAKGPFEALEDFELFLIGKHEVFPPIEELNEPEEMREIRKIIVEMKNYAELGVDLAYSSLIFRSKDAANEVMMLEAKVDTLRKELEEKVLKHAKMAESIEALIGILRIAWSCERISDAAQELAEVVITSDFLHSILAEAVEESEEVIVRIQLPKDSKLIGKSLGELDLEGETGVQIVAIRKARDSKWIYHPKGDASLDAKDVIIVKGSEENMDLLMKKLQVPLKG
jgi:uncharacterized protein with PhoU and TrkA domain